MYREKEKSINMREKLEQYLSNYCSLIIYIYHFNRSNKTLRCLSRDQHSQTLIARLMAGYT